MNNSQIIFAQSQKLAQEGLLAYTGRVFVAEINGEKVEIKETEQIHTYQEWKKLGYQVQKGEKAVARFQIWMHTGRKDKDIKTEDGKEVTIEDGGHYYRKEACFFALHQVTAKA